jgi:hypothetical protein
VLKAWVTETKKDVVRLEELDELGEVREGPGQAIELVDHHDIDKAGPDVGQEPLQGRAVDRGAGEAAIVIAGRECPPALMGLALDVGL